MTARVAASAFTVHALLLLLDFFFFGSAYAGVGEHDRLWPALRIVAVCLLAWSLLQGAPRRWLIGAIACTAFLIHDLFRLRDIFAGPPLGPVERLLTSALLMSLLVGIGASWWPVRR